MVADRKLEIEDVVSSDINLSNSTLSKTKLSNTSLNTVNGSNAPTNAGTVLTSKEIHPLALEGARRLISRHTTQTPVEIKSWGTPDAVYSDVRQSLLNFGYQIGMAEDMAEKLVEHAENHSDASRKKYGANIIALKIEVSKEKPQPQFQTGALESQRIDGVSNTADVAGATSVAIGINTGGTFTTALRDGVAEIMQAMGSSNQAVWIDFEAPDKSELQGIANNAAMSAMAQIAGGSLTPETIAELQSYADMELLSPVMMGALENLYSIQIAAAGGNLDLVKGLSQDIIKNLSTMLENGDATPDMLSSAIEALEIISDTHGLKTSIDMTSLMTLKQNVQIAKIVSKLDTISSGLEGTDLAIIQELMDGFSKLEGEDLLSHLDTIPDQLKAADVDGFDIADISSDVSVLKDTITQNLPLDQKLEILSVLGAQDLMNVLQELKGIENLPPELAELLEKLDVENLSIEALQEALTGKGDPALVEAVQGTIIALSSPEIQAALPQATLNPVNQFLGTQEALVDAVIAKAVSTDLSAALIDLDPTSSEAVKIQKVINRLEAGESIDKVDPSIIEAVADKLEGAAADKLNSTINTLNNVNIDTVTIGSDTRAEITTLIQSAELDSSAIKQLETALETGNLNAAIEVLAQNPEVGAPTLASLISTTQSDHLSPEAKSEITNLIAEIKKDPSLLQDPDVLSVVQQAIGLPPSSATPVGVIPSVVTLAQSGGQAIKIAAAFSVPAVTQQLNAIKDSLPSGSQVSEAVSSKVQAVSDIIAKLDTPKPPSVREVVSAVQNLNAVAAISTGSKAVSNAVSSQILAIKGQLQTMVPKDITPKISGALKEALPARESIKNTALTAKTNVANRLAALKTKVETAAQKFTPPAKDYNAPRQPINSAPKETNTIKNPKDTTIVEPVDLASSDGKKAVAKDVQNIATANFDFKESFTNATNLRQQANTIKNAASQKMGQAWNIVKGCPVCTGCGACGTALKQAATVGFVKPIQGLGKLLGITPKTDAPSVSELNLNK